MVRKVLVALFVFNTISAFWGGAGVASESAGMDPAMLAGTGFSSFFVPGLLLAFVVGGSQLAAAIAVHRRLAYAAVIAYGAAFVLAGWMFCQVSLIGGGYWMQWLWGALALLEIGLVAVWTGGLRPYAFRTTEPQSMTAGAVAAPADEAKQPL